MAILSQGTTSQDTIGSQPEQVRERVRLDYLDGLRGLSALYVVFNHASILAMTLLGDDSGSKSHIGKLIHFIHFYLFNYGDYAVCMFIVLSGYCLMLPVVQSNSETLRGGVWQFVLRRARRICPPYYAALALCLLFFWLAPLLRINTHEMSWHVLAMPVFQPGVIISHLLLMHCWTPWIHRIDPPMWSVSVEWNIYFAFAFLLLPVFKKLGIGVAVLIAFVLGIAPHFLCHSRFDDAHPWMLGLFALGMFGAAVNFSKRPNETQWNRSLPWGGLCWGCAVLLAFLTSIQRASLANITYIKWLRPEAWGGQWPLEILVGVWGTILIIYCTRALSKNAKLPGIVKALESRASVKLGVFSYSIYLIHALILELSWLWLKVHASPTAGAILMYIAAVPASVIFAYGFHLAFERPFLPGHFRKVLAEQSLPTVQREPKESQAY